MKDSWTAIDRWLRDDLKGLCAGTASAAQQQQWLQQMKKQYRIKKMRFGWLRFVQVIAMLSELYHHLMHFSIDPPCLRPWSRNWPQDCSALTEAQIDIFGRSDFTLDVQFTSPQEVITLAGRTVFWEPPFNLLTTKLEVQSVTHPNQHFRKTIFLPLEMKR